MPIRRTNPSAPTHWLPVPLDPPHPCQPCHPIPRSYTDHGGLSRHLRQQHGINVSFQCRNCGLQDELKKVNLHIKKTPAYASAADAFTMARAQAATAASAAPADATNPHNTSSHGGLTPGATTRMRCVAHTAQPGRGGDYLLVPIQSGSWFGCWFCAGLVVTFPFLPLLLILPCSCSCSDPCRPPLPPTLSETFR